MTEERIIARLKYLRKTILPIESQDHKFIVYRTLGGINRMTLTGYNIAIFKPRNAQVFYRGISDVDLLEVAKKLFDGQ
jgi:hypothetical protein